MRKKRSKTFRRELLDAGVARLGVGPDRAHADAGVVDQGLNRAEARARRLDRPQAAGLLPEIGRDAVQPLVRPAKLRQPLQRSRVAVDRGDAVAVVQQRPRHHPPDAAGSPGQQHNTAHHFGLPSPPKAYWLGAAIVEYAQPLVMPREGGASSHRKMVLLRTALLRHSFNDYWIVRLRGR
jgi:hypothetical protein